jgi:hypothetical protein
VCQSATSEARTARIAPPGRPARDTVVGPRPADASWTYNAQTLGQLRADTPRIPGGRSLQRRDRGAGRQRARAQGAGRELKMPWNDFCLIPRGVAIQVQRSAISATRGQVPGSARERAGGAHSPMGPRVPRRGPPGHTFVAWRVRRRPRPPRRCPLCPPARRSAPAGNTISVGRARGGTSGVNASLPRTATKKNVLTRAVGRFVDSMRMDGRKPCK